MALAKYIMMRHRDHSLAPGYWNLLCHTSPEVKRLYGAGLTKTWLIFIDKRAKYIMRQRDWDRAAGSIARRLETDRRYFTRIEARVTTGERAIEKLLLRFKQIEFGRLSIDQLAKIAKQIQGAWLYYDNACVPAWFIGGDVLKSRVQKICQATVEEIDVLVMPNVPTAASQLEHQELEYALRCRAHPKLVGQFARRLSDSYHWIPFGYDGPTHWSVAHFQARLQKLARRSPARLRAELSAIRRSRVELHSRQQKIIARLKLNAKQRRLIKLLQTITIWTDDRKKLEFQLHYRYHQTLFALETRLKIEPGLLHSLLAEELPGLARPHQALIKQARIRQRQGFVLCVENSRTRILPAKQAADFRRAVQKQLDAVTDLRGTVASRGPKAVYRGRARVLFTPLSERPITEKDFLVATMTTPEYMRFMRRAVGFITDEGGVTCHAAIVAREMNKPCVIGTKIATKVLKDGDLIEVDAVKGSVKVIQRAGVKDKRSDKA